MISCRINFLVNACLRQAAAEFTGQGEKKEVTPIKEIFKKQRNFFNTQKTKDLNFRIAQLKTLHRALNDYNDRISDAMYADLRRSKPLTYYSEIGISLKSISMTMAGRSVLKFKEVRSVESFSGSMEKISATV